jgi:hypothetical protein
MSVPPAAPLHMSRTSATETESARQRENVIMFGVVHSHAQIKKERARRTAGTFTLPADITKPKNNKIKLYIYEDTGEFFKYFNFLLLTFLATTYSRGVTMKLSVFSPAISWSRPQPHDHIITFLHCLLQKFSMFKQNFDT